MTTKFKRVLFDYDGTLIIHDKRQQGKRIAELLKIPTCMKQNFIKRIDRLFATSYGNLYYANKKMSYELYSYSIEQIMGPLIEFGISVKDLDQAINENVKTYSKLAPNAKEILSYLQDRGYEICLFTNGFYNYQVANMKHNGILDYFERIYAWDNWYAKPDKRAFKRALGTTEPRENIFIGDNLFVDIAPAKALGIYTVGINVDMLDETKINPDITITDLKYLKNIL